MTDATGRYPQFGRDEWADLRATTPLTLGEHDLDSLRGINESIDLDEVATVYLPLTRLLNLYVSSTQQLHRVSAQFLGTSSPKVPYIMGISGSVAVGTTDLRADLKAFTMPTLIAHGDSDRIVPFEVSGKLAHAMIPGSRLELLHGFPHGFAATHAQTGHASRWRAATEPRRSEAPSPTSTPGASEARAEVRA